jgi:anti-sigma-K factor RskA
MMAYSEDQIALAAEYALGTASAEERGQVETMMAADADYAHVVDAWVRQLGVLNQMVGAVEPRAEVWDRIKAAISVDPKSHLALSLTPNDALDMIAAAKAVSDPAPSVNQTTPAVAPAAGVESAPVAPTASNVIDFPQQLRRWRAIATATSAIAAVLVAFIAVQAYRPELLPTGVRPKPLQQTAQAPSSAQTASVMPAQYVALLQKDATSPAFILTVDAGTKNFTVRKVNAANEPGRSYELWIVSDKLQKPRSLGVIGSHDFTIRPDLASYAPDMVNQATYAVTDEPEGGSPTGQATGPIVFTGKLIETVPQVK